MENLKALQKEEALKRLKKLVQLKEVITSFKDDNHKWICERQNSFFKAVLYDANINSSDENYQKILNLINEFEEKYNSLVYLVQLTHFEFGDQLALFYVSPHIEEWKVDQANIMDKVSLVYILNNYNFKDWNNEFGYIGIEHSMGAIYRTY